jgi:hypothetical protein
VSAPEFSPDEVDALHAEVQRDIAAGDGDKHFEDVIDALHSRQGDASVEETAQQREDFERFARALRSGLREQLAPQGLWCQRVIEDGKGTGLHITFRDRQNRRFDVEYGWDDGLHAYAKHGESGGRAVMHEICEKVLAARETYFARMGVAARPVLLS